MVTEDESGDQVTREEHLAKISASASEMEFRNLTPEEKNYVKKQMRGIGVVQKKNDNSNGNKRQEEIVHKYSSKGQGPLREAVTIAGIPYFIKKSFIVKRNEYVITVDPYIEEPTKKLRPPFAEECPYITYEFQNVKDPNLYLHRAIGETIDSLYRKVKVLTAKFNDVDEKTLTLLTANIVGSYFQDRCSTVHYLFVLGDNGTGKSAFGTTHECLGYRAVNITNATEAFWFRVFGSNEAGQVTIIAEEFDRIDEKSQIMAMLKEGYHPNAKVPRMNNENTKMDFFLPFGFKIMIAERSPSEDRAKGLLDRSLPVKTYRGVPKYDIKEVRNPQGNKERYELLDQMMDLRKLLLVFRILHYVDPLPEVEVGLDGRDKELCKPLLQLFFGMGASKKTLIEVEKALKYFLDIKNNRKENSHEALIYPIVVNSISEFGNTISSSKMWHSITNSLEGYSDKYVDKDGNEYFKNPNMYSSADYGPLYRNSIIKLICDKFGAKMIHRKSGNELLFNPDHVLKMGKIYGESKGIQTKLVRDSSVDAGDAGDTYLRDLSDPINEPGQLNDNRYLSNSPQTEEIKGQNNSHLGLENSLPIKKSESRESHESLQTRDYPSDCYYCKEIFDGIGKEGYEKHVIQKHPKKPCYPGKSDIKLHSLAPKGMPWEI